MCVFCPQYLKHFRFAYSGICVRFSILKNNMDCKRLLFSDYFWIACNSFMKIINGQNPVFFKISKEISLENCQSMSKMIGGGKRSEITF